jgi:superfamily II DNA or RNA helicase
MNNDYYMSLSEDWWSLEPNQRRTLRQADILDKWIDAKARGYVLAVTGFGKTRVGENAIIKMLEKDPNRIVIVIVPHNAAKSVWLGVKAKIGKCDMHVRMAHTYLELNENDRTADLLIIDECHRFANEDAELFGKVIDATCKRWILPLSATLSDEHKEFLESRGIQRVDQVTMKEARECNYVAPHDNYIVSLDIQGKDKMELDKLDKLFHKTWRPFEYKMQNLFLAMGGGSESTVYRDNIATRIGCNHNEVYGLAKNGISAMRERKVFLQKAPSKIDVVEQIVNQFPDKKIITFGEFTDVADKITERLGSESRSFHSAVEGGYKTVIKKKQWKTEKSRDKFYEDNRGSKVELSREYNPKDDKPYIVSWKEKKRLGTATMKAENMRLFETTSDVMVLNTAKALDEAADIDNVEIAIIVSFSKTARQLIQRVGRVVRFKEGKRARIFILCITRLEKRTQEERWLKEATKELDEYQWITPESIKHITDEEVRFDTIEDF